MAEQDLIDIVHVTHYNSVMWDNGLAATKIIEHGLADPGYRFTGEREGAAVVVYDAIRRGRITGSDLIPAFAREIPISVYGYDSDIYAQRASKGENIAGHGHLDSERLLGEMGRHRLYIHPNRWTSVGFSLIEAMMTGLPAVAFGSTEAYETVPPDSGLASTNIDKLVRHAKLLCNDPEMARETGLYARGHALERFSLARFLKEWDEYIDAVSQRNALRGW